MTIFEFWLVLVGGWVVGMWTCALIHQRKIDKTIERLLIGNMALINKLDEKEAEIRELRKNTTL